MRLSENGYFPQSLRQTQILILKILQCIFAVKSFAFLDLVKNLSFSDKLLGRSNSVTRKPCAASDSLLFKKGVKCQKKTKIFGKAILEVKLQAIECKIQSQRLLFRGPNWRRLHITVLLCPLYLIGRSSTKRSRLFKLESFLSDNLQACIHHIRVISYPPLI